MKITIMYVSQTGNTEMAAEYIQDGILEKYPFIQVKLMDIRDGAVDIEFLLDSEAVIFGSPVYFTSMGWELKKWFDNSFRINLDGKLGAVFVTANSLSGGTDTAIAEIQRHMLAKGMLIYSGGNEKHFQIGAVCLGSKVEESEKMLLQFGENVAGKVVQLFGK